MAIRRLMNVSPIEKPTELNPFKHFMFVVTSDNLIEKVIPDIEQKYFDGNSTGSDSLKDDSIVGYFEPIKDYKDDDTIF